MESSESEPIFDSLNLNPQLFINAALNIVDELIQSAFDHLHQEASTQLKVDGSDRAEDLTKGLDYIRNTIQSSLDKRLTMWEKYCFLRLFVVPEGFSLPKDDEASVGDIMDVDVPDLDSQLVSLRTKLTLAEQETGQLKREIQAFERESAINNHQATAISELTKLSDQISENDAFQELQKLAAELSMKVEKLKTEREDETQSARFQQLHLWNEDLLKIIGGNGKYTLQFSPMQSQKKFKDFLQVSTLVELLQTL
uniref:Uncharacterized protein n=1 Tax=Lactuca sativa TaxID=4236 RepID=A0A9R1XGA8_LACSA|nr:hypothetical protein LSAT_V11C400201680 [Lactuca sativa]